jgi:hypothetical protein
MRVVAGRLTFLAAFASGRSAVVVTDRTMTRFRRIEQELPGIEEIRPSAEHFTRPPPTLIRPAISDSESPCFVHRDREEELRHVVRAIRSEAAATGHELRERTAVVFQRPLPYLYPAQQVFADGRVPFQTFDALPLAAEAYAAVLDLVLDFAAAGGTRETTTALLRSPALAFVVDSEVIAANEVAALDMALMERRASGEADSSSLRSIGRFRRRNALVSTTPLPPGAAGPAPAKLWRPTGRRRSVRRRSERSPRFSELTNARCR